MFFSIRSGTASCWTRVLRGLGMGLLALALVGLGAGCGGAGSNEAGNGGSDDGGDDGGDGGDDTTTPAAPAGLDADATDGAIALSWNAVDEADTYRVYRATSSTDGVEGSVLATDLSETSYQDTGAENGTTYYYRVTAVDDADNQSNGSDEAKGTPFAPPSELTGTSGDSKIELNWGAAAGAESYSVYRDTSSMEGAQGEPLTTDLPNAAYTDTTAKNGTKYYYRVTSVNPENEESAATNEVGKAAFSNPPDRP